MISRVWHGCTSPQSADVHENLLRTEIFGGIFAKEIAGFERIELFRRDVGEEVAFMTVMGFASLKAVKAFAGEDYEIAYVPAAARAVLAHFDARSRHYEVRAGLAFVAELRFNSARGVAPCLFLRCFCSSASI